MSDQNQFNNFAYEESADYADKEPLRRRLSRRSSVFLKKRKNSYVRSSIEIADVIDDGDDDIRNLKRAFSSIEGNAGDDGDPEMQDDVGVLNNDDNKVREESIFRRLLDQWTTRIHWLCLVAISWTIFLVIWALGKKDEAFALINIPHWALFLIPTFILLIFILVEFSHFVFNTALNQVWKKSHWLVRVVLNEVLNRFKVVMTFLLVDALVVSLLLNVTAGVPMTNLWFPHSVLRAVYILSTALAFRSVFMQVVRDRLSKHLFEQSVADLSFAKDMLVLLCIVDDIDEKEVIKQKWAQNKRRNDYDVSLQRTATSVLQLPLKIVESDGNRTWEYSADTMIEISSAQQMRLVAAGLRDAMFRSSTKLSFPYLRTILGVDDNDLEHCFETLFKRSDGDYSPITSDEFYACVQTVYTDRADLHHKVESFLNAADIGETAVNVLFLALYVLLLLWSFGVRINSFVLALPAILPTIAFAISQSVTDLVESIVFVTIRRPYGIGDLVQIDGADLVVVRIAMLTTDFVGIDHRLVTMSNSQLSKMPIFNHRRAGQAVVVFQANIAYTTEPEKLQQLRKIMVEYVAQHSDSWRPDVAMLMNGLNDGASLLVTFKFFHRLAWHESILPQSKTEIIQQLRQAMKSLEIANSEPTAWVNVDSDGRPC